MDRPRDTLLRRALLPVVALCGLSVLVLACGDDDDSSGSQSEMCAARDSLDQSVQELKDVNITQNGLSSLESAIDDVKTNAKELADSGTGDVKADAQQLETQLSDLGKAIGNVASTGVAPITDAASKAKETADKLVADLQAQQCP